MKIIGHKEVINSFKNALNNNSVSHAHLIIGEDGIGKSLVAKEFAMSILGVEKDKDYIDIIEYRTDKESFGIDYVRKIIDEANKKPYEFNKKIIIVYNGEKLTTQAQNAFLKTIEEPPKGVFIIITSSSSEGILDTIKSRCQIYKLWPLNKEEMLEFLRCYYRNISEEKINSLLSFSEGIPGRIERLVNDESFNTIRQVIIELLKEISTNSSELILKYSDTFSKFRGKEDEILSIFTTFIRDIIIYKEISDNILILNSDKIKDIEEIANIISYKKLEKIMSIIDETRMSLKSNINLWGAFSTMLINILEE
ncbi:MAG: DNA polymerase III subunit delta' [Clostridium perfringens]|nr:DNA polymerase III subunit delta' [Clostridium perfringens]